MANLGKRPVTRADAPKPETTYVFEGEQRLDRRPEGRVSRFVDPVGNVVSLQLAASGDPNPAATVQRQLAVYNRDGFVEHAKCPILTGAFRMGGPVGQDLAELPPSFRDACADHPKVMTKSGGQLYAQKGCRHIEALIDHRRTKEAAAQAKRNAGRLADEKFAQQKRELEILQLEKLKAEMETKSSKSRKE